jgi:CBS domain-containing protein
MRIEEIMTHNIACCTPDTSLGDVARMMTDCDCGVIPVVEGDGSRQLIGVVTDRDIVCRLVAEGRNPLQFHASDAMSIQVISASPETEIDEACRLMEEHKVRRLPVCDQDGRCLGIVSQADIARHLDEHHTGEVVRYISEPAGAAQR